MALKKISWIDGKESFGKRALRLAAAGVDEVSAFYAVMARILIARGEDFSDLAAERRLKRLDLAAARQHAVARPSRRAR